MKTFLAALCAVVSLAGTSAPADTLPRTAEARLALFAQCAGRFSAEMEHHWLFGRDGRSAERDRARMVGLIEALLPGSDMPARSVLAMRIDAKMAHAALLARADFAEDPRARALAHRHLARCAAVSPAPPALAALR